MTCITEQLSAVRQLCHYGLAPVLPLHPSSRRRLPLKDHFIPAGHRTTPAKLSIASAGLLLQRLDSSIGLAALIKFKPVLVIYSLFTSE